MPGAHRAQLNESPEQGQGYGTRMKSERMVPNEQAIPKDSGVFTRRSSGIDEASRAIMLTSELISYRLL